MIARKTSLGIRVDGNGKHFTLSWLAANKLNLPQGQEFRAVQNAGGRLSAWAHEDQVLVFDGPVTVTGGSYLGDLVGTFCRATFEEITGVKQWSEEVGRFDLEVLDVLG